VQGAAGVLLALFLTRQHFQHIQQVPAAPVGIYVLDRLKKKRISRQQHLCTSAYPFSPQGVREIKQRS